MSKKSHILFSAAVISTFMVSCGSMKNTATVHKTSKYEQTTTFEIPSKLHPQSNALLTEAKKWLGTPYKYGGQDKRGVDCSGLVLNVYQKALDIKLPRNSGEQASFCSPLAKDKLLPGDLLFFATSGSGKVSHVGIYVGDNKMIHSSASRGVIVSNISEAYYLRTFAGAGFVEKYHAMISTGGNPPIEVKDQMDVAAPFTYTPVATLPEKNKPSETLESNTKTATVAVTPQAKTTETKTASVRNKTTAPVKVATSGNTSVKSEPNEEEARKAVLNSLIEQKLDSIFNR